MSIFLNGAAHDIAADSTLASLVLALDLVGKRIAIEVNENIVPRSLHGQTLLREGDRVEIVHAIGGG